MLKTIAAALGINVPILIASGIGLAALSGAVWWTVHSLEQRGADKALQKIEESNRAAEQNADSAIQNVTDCARRGGDWDRVSGMCDYSSPRQ